MKTFGIVGLGNIGAGYDFSSKFKDTVLTHLQAIKARKNSKLSFAVDKLSYRHTQLEPGILFSDISEVTRQQVDVIIICVNTKNLVKCAIEAIGRFEPKIVIIEKPVSENFQEINRLIELSKNIEVAIFVNFMRRTLPEINFIKNKICNASPGTFFRSSCDFSGSFINNGIHYLDLQTHLFGPIKSIKCVEQNNYHDIFQVIHHNAISTLTNNKLIPVRSDDLVISCAEFRYSYMNGGKRIFLEKVSENKLFPEIFEYTFDRDIKSNIHIYMEHFYAAFLSSEESVKLELGNLTSTAELVKKITRATEKRK